MDEVSRRIRLSAAAAVCLLLACAGVGAKPQDKTADAGGEETVYASGQVDVKAVVKLSASDIPSGEGCRDRQGSVILRAVLRRSGEVTDIEVRRKSGCRDFDERAIRAVKKTKFTPAQKDGVAVSQYHMRQFTYRLW